MDRTNAFRVAFLIVASLSLLLVFDVVEIYKIDTMRELLQDSLVQKKKKEKPLNN